MKNNLVLEQPNLSLEAKAIFSYLINRNKVETLDDIANSFTNKKEDIIEALKELRSEKYLHLERLGISEAGRQYKITLYQVKESHPDYEEEGFWGELNGNKHIEVTLYCSENDGKELEEDYTDIHTKVKKLFGYYKYQYSERISSKEPVFNWAQCEKLTKPHLKKFGLERMKELLDAYFESDKQIYQDNAYSLSTFLSTKIIHRLNQKVD